MAGTFNEDVEPDEDSPSFVENCLEEIRSKTLSTHLSKIASTKCDKAVLGMLVEAAVKRGDAVDDVLRTIFERLVGGGGGGSGGEDSENAEEIADKRLYVFRKGIELIQREGRERETERALKFKTWINRLRDTHTQRQRQTDID